MHFYFVGQGVWVKQPVQESCPKQLIAKPGQPMAKPAIPVTVASHLMLVHL